MKLGSSKYKQGCSGKIRSALVKKLAKLQLPKLALAAQRPTTERSEAMEGTGGRPRKIVGIKNLHI